MSDELFFNTLVTKSLQPISGNERFFEGYLTVEVKDKQGEITVVDELIKVLPIWMDRGAPITDTHSNRVIGKGINYQKTIYKAVDGLEYPAIKIIGKIHSNYELDNEIWNRIKSGEYKGLSFGGATKSNRTPFRMKDGSIAYQLKDLEHYEVAVCKDPAVPLALITDFNPIAKAIANETTIHSEGKMLIRCTNFGCVVNKAEIPEGVELNKPIRDEGGEKKFKVYVKDPQTGNIKIVRFGDPNMEIKRDDPERRESFRARHDCENATDITTPQYWSCKMWEKDTSVTEYTQKTEQLDPNPEDDDPKRIRDRAKVVGTKQNIYQSEIPEQRIEVGTTVEKTDGEEAKEVIEREHELKGEKPSEEEKKIHEKVVEEQEKEDEEDTKKAMIELDGDEMVIKVNLGELRTFREKVEALKREGKSQQSAENIVGAYVKGEKTASLDPQSIQSGDRGLGADPVVQQADSQQVTKKEVESQAKQDKKRQATKSAKLYKSTENYINTLIKDLLRTW